MRHWFYIVIILVSGFLLLPINSAGENSSRPLTDIIARFDDEMAGFDEKIVNDTNFNSYIRARHAAFRRAFPQNLQKTYIAGADKALAEQLYSSVYSYLLATNDTSQLAFLEAIFARQKQNNWLNNEDMLSMHRMYLILRLFDKAARFRAKYPQYNLPAPPEIKPAKHYIGTDLSGARPVINTVSGKDFLEYGNIDFSSFTGVVVIGNPKCHFFNNFMKDIGSDSAMANAFIDNALWLTDSGTSLTNGAVIKWNNEMPKVRFRYVVYESDWPEINFWGSPGFYFYKNGKLVKKIIGWPRNAASEKKAKLTKGFAAIGIKISRPAKRK